jgi:hypothetical protein
MKEERRITTAAGEVFDLMGTGEVFKPCDLHSKEPLIFSRWCAHCLDVNGLVDPHDARLPYLRRVHAQEDCA